MTPDHLPTDSEHQLGRFETAWAASRRPGGPARPDWHNFKLPEGHQDERPHAVALIVTDIQYRLGAGENPPLAPAYHQDDSLRLSDDQWTEIIHEEYLSAWRLCRPVRRVSYLDEFKALGSLAEHLIPTWNCPTRNHCPLVCQKADDEDLLDLKCPSCGWTGQRADLCSGGFSAGDFPDVPGYKIESILGSGGFAVVYKAKQLEFNRVVALKMLRIGFPSQADLRRFEMESDSIAQLKHTNIIVIHGKGDFQKRPFFTLEFCEGGSLKEQLAASSRHPTKEFVQESAALVEKLARAVDHAHQNDVIHRDLKPGNVLFMKDGTPKIADFGLAKQLEQEGVTITGQILGTPQYMAPEQADPRSKRFGGIDRRTDVYALGAILFECITGQPPFSAEDGVPAQLHRVCYDDPPPARSINQHVPRDLDAICHKCLAKQPALRYKTAAALAEDLGRFIAGEPTLARPRSWAAKFIDAQWRQHRLRTVVASALLLSSAAVLVAVWFRNQEKAAASARDEAVLAKGREEVARKEADRAKHRAKVTEAELSIRIGEDLLDSGEVAEGMLWLDRGLGELPASEVDRKLAARRHIAAALPRIHHLERFYSSPHYVRVAAVSPDQTRLLLGGDDEYVHIIDAANDADLPSPASKDFLGFRRPVVERTSFSSGAFSPDGKVVVLASEGNESRVRLLDSLTGEELAGVRRIDQTRVKSVTFTPDGKRIVACGQGRDKDGGFIRVYDAKTGDKLPVTFPCEGSLYAGVVHKRKSDARELLATAGRGPDYARVWDLSTGQPVSKELRHEGPVFSVAFHPDGDVLVTGDLAGNLLVWDTTTFEQVGTKVRAHTEPVRTVAFSRDGGYMVTASEDKTARVWVWHRGRRSFVPHGNPLRHTGQVHRATFLERGNDVYVLTGGYDKAARLWRVAVRDNPTVTAWTHGAGVTKSVVSRDGRLVLAGCKGEGGYSQLYNVGDKSPLGPQLKQEGEVMDLALNLDGSLAASVGNNGVIRVWDTATRTAKRTVAYPDPNGKPGPLAARCVFSPTNRGLLAVGGSRGTVLLIDAESEGFTPLRGTVEPKDPPRTLTDTAHATWAVTFSPDGKQLLTAGSSGYGTLWQVDGGKLVAVIGHLDDVKAAAFSPDGRHFVTCGMLLSAKLWDRNNLHDGKGGWLNRALAHEGEVHAVVFSPDGSHLFTAAADGTVRRWRMSGGEAAWPTPAVHNSPVRTLALSGDGSILASGSDDGRVRLWRADTGVFLGAVLRHAGPVNSVAFLPGDGPAPDSPGVLTASEDGTARLWRPPPPVSPDVDEVGLRAYIESMTGMKLLPDGVVRILPRNEWLAARDAAAPARTAISRR